MALSMDEQRMLAEIERRLAAEDPGLAARLSTFRRPGRVTVFRSARARVIGSLFTVAVVAMVSLDGLRDRAFSVRFAYLWPSSGDDGLHGTGQAKLSAGPGKNPAKPVGQGLRPRRQSRPARPRRKSLRQHVGRGGALPRPAAAASRHPTRPPARHAAPEPTTHGRAPPIAATSP